jgi:hypothetical protein
VAQLFSLGSMNSSHIHFEFSPSDEDLAEIIASATPPEGITVSKPGHVIKASAETGGVFVHIAIEFAVQVSATIVAAWIYDCWKKHTKKKSARINRQQASLTKRTILRLIKQELAEQKAREEQYKRDHDNAA